MRGKKRLVPTALPSLITRVGNERLLVDEVTTAVDADARVYDAATNKPTQGRTRLRAALSLPSGFLKRRTSGATKENRKENDGHESKARENTLAGSAVPPTFNPIVRVEWTSPEKLYFETAYVRLIPNDPIMSFQCWNLLILSPGGNAK